MSRPAQPLTRVAEDYLKAIWSAEEWDGGSITTKQLATRFGITAATVSATLRRLADQGLIVHEAYGPIVLTAIGRRHALAMVRRHRLLETFLAEILHYDWTEVHDEAEELEHAASDQLIDRIAAVLGDPTADPHGDPIPSATGALDRPARTFSLAGAAPGDYRVIRVADADPAALGRLGVEGIAPGRRVSVLTIEAGRVVLRIEDHRRSVSSADAAAVTLEPNV